MTADTLDFTGDLLAAEQGSRFYTQITLTQGGTAIDLTGDAFALNVTADWGASATLLSATTANGKISITDATNGVLVIDVPETTMNAVVAGTYVYDFARVPDGVAANRYVVFRGKFEVRPSAKAGS